jgi:hypothetical protein
MPELTICLVGPFEGCRAKKRFQPSFVPRKTGRMLRCGSPKWMAVPIDASRAFLRIHKAPSPLSQICV